MQVPDKFTSKFSQNPSFSFRNKVNYITKSNSKDLIPSPNLYSPQVVKTGATFSKFSTAKRKSLFNIVPKNSPGPGLYQANSSFISKSKSLQKQKKPFFTISQRFQSNSKKIPGPGQYQIRPILPNSPKFSMAKKNKTIQQCEVDKNKQMPSPGAYQVQNIHKYINLSISVPKSLRMKSQRREIPGPGAYTSQEKLFSSQRSFLKKSFSSISQQKRKIDFSIKNDSPGPGNYDTLSLFQLNNKAKKGFSLRSLLNTSQIKTPAPNQYNTLPNFRYKLVNCKISKELRSSKFLESNKFIPGPGAYNNTNKIYQKVNFRSLVTKFSKSARNLVDINKSTDQLFYEDIQKQKKTTPSFSIGHQNRKTDRFINKQIPGPGAYNPQEKLTKQTNLTSKFSKSARMRNDLSKAKIGPGSYKIQELSKGSGVKFSKEKRNSVFQQMAEKHMVIGQLSKISQTQKLNNKFNNGTLLSLKFNQHKIKQYNV